jgi:hypothetical protein
MLFELRVQVKIVELVVTARVTVVVKPFTGLIVIVDMPIAPTFIVTFVGFAAIVKNGCDTIVT